MVTGDFEPVLSAHVDETETLRAAHTVLTTNFAQLLTHLLRQRHHTRIGLYDYLFSHGYELDQGAMYRYFNPNSRVTRLPAGRRGRQFLSLFCDYLELSETQRTSLLFIWQVQRQQSRKNGAHRLD